MENIWTKFSNMVLLGDLTNLLQDERGDTLYEGNKMKGILEQFNMKNMVKGPTRTEKIWSNKKAYVPWVSQITTSHQSHTYM